MHDIFIYNVYIYKYDHTLFLAITFLAHTKEKKYIIKKIVKHLIGQSKSAIPNKFDATITTTKTCVILL